MVSNLFLHLGYHYECTNRTSDEDADDIESPTEEEIEEDLLAASNAEQEIGLEPQRPQSVMPDVEDDTMTGPAARLRGGAEEVLLKKPFVVKFPSPHAGKVYSRGSQTSDEKYEEVLGNSENPFAPFTSQLDWDVARWAKLRGPSSTAFTELMDLEGVHQISYYRQ